MATGTPDSPVSAGPPAGLRILGIDPGTRVLGFGVVEVQGARVTALAHGTLRLAGEEDFTARLLLLHRELGHIIAEFRPTEAAIEEVFVGRSMKSALRSAEGRGALMLTLGLAGLAIHQYAPRTIKQSVTGRGGADKQQVQDMVGRLLSLRTPPSPDAADALAVALAHATRSRLPDAPATQKLPPEVLAGIKARGRRR